MTIEFIPEDQTPRRWNGPERRVVNMGPPAELRDRRLGRPVLYEAAMPEGDFEDAAAEAVHSDVLDLTRVRERVEAAHQHTETAPDEDDATETTLATVTSLFSATEPTQSVNTIFPELNDVPSKAAEKESAPKFKLRYATPEDIDDIVDVDIRSFDSVYTGYGMDDATLRADLRQKFMGRLEKVGSEWMPVIERDGKIVGFMTCCPTNKTPEEFVSWEQTTDDGTLETTYDPNGKNVYVVTLSVLPEGSEAKNMLYANQIGRLIRDGYNTSFFESRIPGFRTWVKKTCKQTGEAFDQLDSTQLQDLAEAYYSKKKVNAKGKEVPYDRLLKLYDGIGCKFLKVVPDAYKDEPSMNFGVVCTYEPESMFDGSLLQIPLPGKLPNIPLKLPQNRFTRWLLGSAMMAASRSQKVSKLI